MYNFCLVTTDCTREQKIVGCVPVHCIVLLLVPFRSLGEQLIIENEEMNMVELKICKLMHGNVSREWHGECFSINTLCLGWWPPHLMQWHLLLERWNTLERLGSTQKWAWDSSYTYTAQLCWTEEVNRPFWRAIVRLCKPIERRDQLEFQWCTPLKSFCLRPWPKSLARLDNWEKW